MVYNLNMEDDQIIKKDQDTDQAMGKDPFPIKRSFTINNGKALNYEHQFSSKKSSNKITFLLVGLLLLIVLGGAFFFRSKIKNLAVGNLQPTPTPVPAVVQPTSTPNPLVKSEWSFEVLNGSGESGLAKKIAAKIQDFGYQVVKSGNADQSDYSQTQVFVKKDLLGKVDLVIADLKDVIKIASVAGQLQEGTASAKIIIGKDSI